MNAIEILTILMEEAHDVGCSDIWFPSEYPEEVKAKRAEYLITTGEYYKLVISPNFVKSIFKVNTVNEHLKNIIKSNNPLDYLKEYAIAFKETRAQRLSERVIGESNF